MLTVYCIPGLGINEEVFRNLDLADCSIRYIKWISPFKEMVQPGDVTGRNEQPSGIGKLILLAISLAAMGIIYFIMKRKNGK